MDTPKTVPPSQSWPYWWWPGWLMTALEAAHAPAPQSLNQPILPGWTFGNIVNITEDNSSSPAMEREIVGRESYGRQLGRLMDALEVLIQERPKDAPGNEAIDQFLEVSRRIKEIKARTLATRVKRIEADLAALRNESPDDYRRITGEYVSGKGPRP